MKKLFMASLALTTFAVSVIIFQMSSCKKSDAQTTNCPTPTYPVAGLWTGTYLTDQVTHPATFYSFIFYPDGTLIAKAKGVPPAQDVILCTGIWHQSGNIVTFRDTTYNYTSTVIQTGQFTFSNTGNMTGGTWANVSGDNGKFYTGTYPTMSRVN